MCNDLTVCTPDCRTISISIKSKFTCRVTSRHDTTRYLEHAFWQRKKFCRGVSRVTTSATGATRTTRVQGPRHGADWGRHVHVTFFRSCSWDWCKSRTQKINLYTRALLLLRRPPCWNEHGATHTTSSTRSSWRARHARHVVRAVSLRAATSGILA